MFKGLFKGKIVALRERLDPHQQSSDTFRLDVFIATSFECLFRCHKFIRTSVTVTNTRRGHLYVVSIQETAQRSNQNDVFMSPLYYQNVWSVGHAL